MSLRSDSTPIQDTIAAFARAPEQPDAWQGALQTLARTARAERVSFLVIRSDGQVLQDSWPPAPDGALEYARDYARLDLRTQRIIGEGRRGVLSTQDLMTAEEIARCPVHNEYYRRWPECWNTLVAPAELEGDLLIPTLQRGAGHGGFEEQERRVLALLAPHIARAAQLRLIVGRDGIGRDELCAAFDAMPETILLLDAFGVLRFANAAARDLLRRRDGLVARRGILAAADGKCRSALDQAIARALRVLSGTACDAPVEIALGRGAGKEPLLVSVTPLPHADPRSAAVLLRARAPRRGACPTLEVVRASLGLTEAEARLALALAKGETIAEHAAVKGISEQTARTHLRNLRDRIGARRQIDVARAVLRLAPS
ncbi:MAG TPA: PAS domain-containing protein [Falsiroseomonas sp.]|jgi:DNA-binding CsgD family transcriptional regulator/PAS domain-containing protein|nr:PAS domain-containing protein [Falsiroseomonas sp.]